MVEFTEFVIPVEEETVTVKIVVGGSFDREVWFVSVNGNVVAVMNVYTVDFEKEFEDLEKQEQEKQDQERHDQNDQSTKEDQAANQDQEKENTG